MLHWISVPANPESGDFSEIRPSPTPAKFLAVQLQYIQLITDQTNADDLWSSVFAILINVTPMIKVQNPLTLNKFGQKLANRDKLD